MHTEETFDITFFIKRQIIYCSYLNMFIFLLHASVLRYTLLVLCYLQYVLFYFILYFSFLHGPMLDLIYVSCFVFCLYLEKCVMCMLLYGGIKPNQINRSGSEIYKIILSKYCQTIIFKNTFGGIFTFSMSLTVQLQTGNMRREKGIACNKG